MKRIAYLVCLFAVAMSIASCGGSKKQKYDESGVRVDTASKKVITPDMIAYQVKGPVKSIIYSTGYTLEYSREGEIFEIKRATDVCAATIFHADDGKLLRATFHAPAEGMSETEMTWTFNQATGDMTQISESGHEFSNTYKYNRHQQGLPTQIEEACGESGHYSETSCLVSYTNFDDKGNWIERHMVGVAKVSEDDGETFTENNVDSIVTRQIIYYE